MAWKKFRSQDRNLIAKIVQQDNLSCNDSVQVVFSMTQLMKLAIERLQALPESQQDQFAQVLLHKLAEDERWVASTTEHLDALSVFMQRILDDDDTVTSWDS